MESLKNCKNHESEKRDKFYKIFTRFSIQKYFNEKQISTLPVEPLIGDGAEKMFDFM